MDLPKITTMILMLVALTATFDAGLAKDDTCGPFSLRYNHTVEICCGIAIHSKPSPNVQCCGFTTYDTKSQICCSGKKYLKRHSRACCGSKTYDTRLEICCAGKVNPKPVSSACCGSTVFDTRSQICCSGKKYLKKHNRACCGSNTYDTQSKICCVGKVHPIASKSTNLCCGGLASLSDSILGLLCQ